MSRGEGYAVGVLLLICAICIAIDDERIRVLERDMATMRRKLPSLQAEAIAEEVSS